MTAVLQRRYQRLLLAYPRAYRLGRGDELLGTLMELSREGQRWPAPRQARALLLGGVRVRVGVDRLHSPTEAWLDGARAALVLMLFLQIITQVWQVGLARGDMEPGDSVSWQLIGRSAAPALVAGVAMLLLLFARDRLGIAVAVLTPLASFLPALGHTWDNNDVVEVAFWWLPVAALAVPLLRRPPARRPWRSSLVLPMLMLASTLLVLAADSLVPLIVTLVLLVACPLWAAAIDPRTSIALGLLLLTAIPQLMIVAAVLIIIVPVLLVVGAALLTTGALRAQHRITA